MKSLPHKLSTLEIRQGGNRKLEPLHAVNIFGFVMGLNVVGRAYMKHFIIIKLLCLGSDIYGIFHTTAVLN
jgi:hypothetical protein